MASEVSLVGQGRATYWASVTALALAASGTDVFTLTGAIGRRITPLMFGVSGVATAAGTFSVTAVKRSGPDTGGSFTSPIAVPGLSTQSPAKAIVRAYTANPTLGTPVGPMMSKRVTSTTASSSAVSPRETLFDFRSHYCGPVELLSEQEVLALNLGFVTVTGGLLDAWVAWTEEYGL